jgi:glycosyltransferase involved in cell wall biosynthesis
MMSKTSGEQPLVAIVTPVFNGAKFLAETMDAVQAQSHGRLVHIVHDNASTDATPEILAQYAQARVPVEVVRTARTSLIAQNWNAAVARVPADARYFRILCADDLIEPEFVERTVALAERNPSVVVVGCGLKHREASATETYWDAGREVFPGQEAVSRFFLGQGLIIAHQTLFRRSALDWRRPFFDEDLVANDTDTCLHLLRHGDWGFVHDVLATTRDHPDTHSRRIKQINIHQCEHLILLERHAPFAFGSLEGRRWVEKYRRYYLRQLVRARVMGTRELFDLHVKVIRKFGARSLLWQFADALADWPLARLGLRPVWTGYPM